MFFKKFSEERKEILNKAREAYLSFRDISKSPGWNEYSDRIQKKYNNIRDKMETSMGLSAEDLKILQIELKVYRDILRIPKEIEEAAKGE